VTIAWERTALGGRAASHVLTREEQARLDALLARNWPPGPFALATAASRAAEAAWFGSRCAQPLWTVDRSVAARAGQHAATGAALVEARFAPGGRLQRVHFGARR
jgi:hypothetical protein